MGDRGSCGFAQDDVAAFAAYCVPLLEDFSSNELT